MNEPRLMGHLLQVTFQRELARAAMDRLESGTPSAVRVHHEVQAILGAAAAISKALWPGSLGGDASPERRAFASRRGELMREALQPDPLLRERSVRNGIEHVDERLDSIMFDDPHAGIADVNVGDFEDFPGHGIHFLRHLDPTHAIASVADAQVNLRLLMEAIDEVADRAQTLLSGR